MSRGRRSPSKDRLLPTAATPIDILYKGIRRKISHTRYVNIFPCLKIRSRMTTKASSCQENDCNEQDMQWEITKMREDNKKVGEINSELRGWIRKEEKLNDIFERRIEGCEVACLPFEKIVEIKLLNDVQNVEEQLMEAEKRLKEVMDRIDHQRDQVFHRSLEPQIALYLILNSFSKGFAQLRQQKISRLQSQTHSICSFNSKIRVLRTRNKQKSQVLEDLEQQIEASRLKMHVPKEPICEASDAGAGCPINRGKTIEEVQSEIEKTRESYKQWEVKMQEEMDFKIQQKLILQKEMHDLTNRMQEMHLLDRSVQKAIKW